MTLHTMLQKKQPSKSPCVTAVVTRKKQVSSPKYLLVQKIIILGQLSPNYSGAT